jgi:hypothetical protein
LATDELATELELTAILEELTTELELIATLELLTGAIELELSATLELLTGTELDTAAELELTAATLDELVSIGVATQADNATVADAINAIRQWLATAFLIF